MGHWTDEFGRHCRGLLRAGTEISALDEDQAQRRNGAPAWSLKTNVREARDVLVRLYKSLYGE